MKYRRQEVSSHPSHRVPLLTMISQLSCSASHEKEKNVPPAPADPTSFVQLLRFLISQSPYTHQNTSITLTTHPQLNTRNCSQTLDVIMTNREAVGLEKR